MGFRGVIPKVRYEGMDPNVVIIDDHLHRAMVGVDVMPLDPKTDKPSSNGSGGSQQQNQN